MRRIKYKKVRKVQPNFFEYTGVHTTDAVEMQLFVYDDLGYEEYNAVSLERVKKELEDPLQKDDVKWLNVHGLHNVELIKSVGDLIGIDNFIISDVLNVSRRTKMDELDEVLFFSIKSVLQKDEQDGARVEQISFLLKDNLLFSFQEKKSEFFTHIRERIKTHSGIVRKKKNDYLLYLLLDAVMENFYITIESYEDAVEKLLVDAKNNHRSVVLENIERERENLNFLKRAIVPLRDALFILKTGREDELALIDKSNYAFFERLHQKSLEILEQIDYDLKSLESASNIFFSMQTQRMNQIMKTLTIFSVIFMPLTFIVGVYGMNFENMPELKSENGYFIVLGVMFLTVIGMVYYFKRKHWF
ncbi:magnesium/cobalt transporter CorA [Flavobacterium sp. PLA-1-15]|uniref:magnesium/cobalt transporter CorA n=1 Tax=Flavobacterium sp. PLA-1-15 TaxID=3380533 RepID=UPI003B805940